MRAIPKIRVGEFFSVENIFLFVVILLIAFGMSFMYMSYQQADQKVTLDTQQQITSVKTDQDAQIVKAQIQENIGQIQQNVQLLNQLLAR